MTETRTTRVGQRPRIPGGELVTVEGAGHQVHAAREDAFLAHLCGALRAREP